MRRRAISFLDPGLRRNDDEAVDAPRRPVISA